MARYKCWVATKEQLQDVMIKQTAYERLQPIEDRFTAHCLFADMYCDYIDLVNRLGYLYHKTFQVQKRELIERLLQATTQRLLELREDLKKVELSEFIYVDRTLKQRKLTPYSVQLIRPEYFPYCRPKEIHEIIKNPRPPTRQIEEDLTETEKEERVKKKRLAAVLQLLPTKVLTEKELALTKAVRIIQIHERLRISRIWRTNIRYDPKKYYPVIRTDIAKKYEFTHKPDQEKLFNIQKTELGRNYFKTVKPIEKFQFYEKQRIEAHSRNEIQSTSKKNSVKSNFLNIKEPEIVIIENTLIRSATIIQRAWRKYCGRKILKRMRFKEQLVCGMITQPKNKRCSIEKINENHYSVCQKVLKFKENFLKAVEDERNRILLVRSPWIMEDISDQIRFWFKEFYDVHGEFHPFPEEVKGGTMLLLLNQTMEHAEFANFLTKPPLSKEEKQKIAAKAKAEKKKQRELKRKRIKAEKLFVKKIAAKGGVYYDMEKVLTTNINTTQIKSNMNDIKTIWNDIDEQANRYEAPYLEWISADKFAEIHKELRVIVDQFLRIEYELLRKALCQDKKRKYRPPKEKKKKGKGKRQKKGKKQPPDITADRTIASLYYEMQDVGLIRSYPKRCFEDFVGDLNNCAYELKNFFGLEILPSTLEVRNILRDWVFGMGPLNLTKKCKSICLGGAPKSGKMLLCDILSSELDAVVIDLSPENVIKYEDNMNYLIHLVNKMSRILQPTIILIEDVHRIFWKKIPLEMAEIKPTLLQKYLQKRIIKPIKNDEKVFVIGTTNEPWAAKPKMNKTFEKVLLLPQTTYSSSYFLWKQLSLKYLGVPRDFEFSPLSWVAKTYSSGKIHETIEKTLAIDRRAKFLRKPLKVEEYVETLIETNDFPPRNEDFAKFTKWNNKANKLAKERIRFLKITQKKDSKNKPKK